MKLYSMKKEAMITLKSNLSNQKIVKNYLIEKNNKWIYDFYGGNPFDENSFIEVPEFNLEVKYHLNGKIDASRTDFNTCKLLYKNLKSLSESDAAKERFWTGLCHGMFYNYVWHRVNEIIRKNPDKIVSKYFFDNNKNFWSNPLSRCWWTAHKLYDETKSNSFEKLDILGANDISSKIILILNRPFSNNPKILNGIIKFFKHCKEKGIKINDIKHQVSPLIQHLNAIGGAIVLDCLSEDEIANIMIKDYENILDGKKTSIKINEEQIIDDEEESTNLNDNDKKVIINSEVTVKPINGGENKIFKINYNERTGKLMTISAELINKKINDIVKIKGIDYKIIEIKN